MATSNAVTEQQLKDDLQIMEGGHLTLRDRHYVVCPRRSNQHVVDAAALFTAIERGYARLAEKHTVRVTPEGWAFCGLL